MIHRSAFALVLGGLLVSASPAAGVEDVYEQGSASVPFPSTTDPSAEFYRKRIEDLGFFGHHVSPAYRGGRDLDFWDRVDAEAPNPKFVLWSLFRIPKHLIWDTPLNMGGTLKDAYIDTWSESGSGLEIAGDLVTGVPNTMMVGLNGFYDTVSNGYTDVYQTVLGSVVLWPLRLSTMWLEGPAPGVYRVVDVIPKTVWSLALPFRKVLVTAGDQGQKGINFFYRTLTDPLDVADHAHRYWGDGGLSSGD